MARLATYVHLRTDDGKFHAFGPDDDLPDWVVTRLADNPRVWAEGEEPDAQSSGIPPKKGRGASRDAWAAYAAANDVETAEDASRDDIIAALDAAGVPTE